MEKRSMSMKVLPLLLIFLGFLTLNMFQGFVAIPCMVIGIAMIIERIWPEKWGSNEMSRDTI